MKASEVRIGNLCKYHVRDSIEGDSFVINTIDYEDIRILFGNEDEDYIPIPLTEEWLLKFGFTKSKKNFSLGVHQKLFSGVMIFIFDKLLQKWIFSIGKYKDITRVQYVHQLQNLYFALTGEELKLK